MALLFKVLKYPTLLGGAFGASYLGYESYMADGYSVSKKPCSGKSVVVVGGGVAGVSSAYYLARQVRGGCGEHLFVRVRRAGGAGRGCGHRRLGRARRWMGVRRPSCWSLPHRLPTARRCL